MPEFAKRMDYMAGSAAVIRGLFGAMNDPETISFGGGAVRFGVYACSPEESSFTAVFTDMKITECQWKAHDGQQPDQE